MKRQKLNQRLSLYVGLGIVTLATLVGGLIVINGTNTDHLSSRSGNLKANVGITLQEKKKKDVDISITKTVNNSTPCAGEQITYTITATNLDKKHKAKGLKIVDVLPTGLDLVSTDTSKGDYDSEDGVWDLEKLKKKKSETLTLIATVTGTGTITNTATYIGSDNPDPNPANDVATAVLTVDPSCTPPPPPPPTDDADLSLTGTSDKSEVEHGDQTKFTFKIKNKGGKIASNIKVHGKFHQDLKLVLANPSKGTFDSVNDDWNIPDLSKGEQQKLELTFDVEATTKDKTLQNDVDIVASDQVDPNTSDNQTQVVLAVTSAPIGPTIALLPDQDGSYGQSAKYSGSGLSPKMSGTISANTQGQSTLNDSLLPELKKSLDAESVKSAPSGTSQVNKAPRRPNVLGPGAQPVVVKIVCPSCLVLSLTVLLVLLFVAALTITSCLVHWSYLKEDLNRTKRSKRPKK